MVINLTMVLVTFNRLEKLKLAIDSIINSRVKPKNLIIVDNASTDGTSDYLDSLSDVIVIHNSKNLGGSGGFYVGQEAALRLDNEWIWFSDDDAYLYEDTLEKVSKHLNVDKKIGAICGVVYEHGEIALEHRKNIYIHNFRIKSEVINNDCYNNDYFQLNAFSYVGTIIRKCVLQELGLVNRDFFIWFDDTEHSLRIAQKYKIFCYKDIRINHDTINSKNTFVSWKDYYGYRNYLYMIKKHFGKFYFIVEKYRKKKYLKKDKIRRQVLKDAILDVKKDILGINCKYLPGAKIG